MGLNAIINGHVNEALGKNQNLYDKRIAICKECPIFSIKSVIGPVCDSKKWYNPKTGQISNVSKVGYKHGCGCALNRKAKLPYSICPLGKW